MKRFIFCLVVIICTLLSCSDRPKTNNNVAYKQLYPNPSDGDLNIVVMVNSPVTTSLEIIDHHGRLTFSRSFELNSPELEAYLDVSSFPEGMYVMHIRQNSLRLTKRFVVVH